MKTYLQPKLFRRGANTMQFIEKETKDSSRLGVRHWLGTYYERLPKKNTPYNGQGREYGAVHRFLITEEEYKALLKGSKLRQRRFRAAN